MCRARTRIGFLPSDIGPSVKRIGFGSCPRQAVAPNCMSGSSRCCHVCHLAGALAIAYLFSHAVANTTLSDWTQQWLMLALLLGFLISTPCGAWLVPIVGGAALLGSSLVGNSDLGGDESLWGLGAFVAAHGAYIALFGGGLFCAYETQRSGRCSMFHRLPLCCSLSCSMAGECRLPSFVSPCCS